MDRRRALTLALVLTAAFTGPSLASARADGAPGIQAAQTAPTRQPDVHFVPTPTQVVDAMLKVAKVTKNDIVYDLGCGDGRIVIAAA